MLRKKLIVTLLGASLLLGCSKDEKTNPVRVSDPKPPAPIQQNRNPIIISSPTTQVNELENYFYQVVATDADGDALTYNFFEKPNWLSSSSNTLSGTAPEVLQDQPFNVKLKVSDGKGGEAEQNYSLTVKNLYNVYVLSTAQSNQLSRIDNASLTFSQPLNFSLNDIVVSTPTPIAPYGFLREITNVSSDRRTFQTKQGTLEKALRDGSFSIRQALTPANAIPEENVEGVYQTFSPSFNFSYDLKDVVLDERFSSVVANGNISFNIEPYLTANFRNPKRFIFQIISDASIDIKLTSTITLSLPSLEKRIKRLNLGTYVFVPPPPSPQIPIVVTPKLDINVGVAASLISPLEARVIQSVNLSPGIVYENGRWSDITTFSNNFNFSIPSIGGNVQTEVYAGPSLSILFYEGLVPGPRGFLNGTLRFEASSLENWKLYGGLEAGLGIDRGLFSSLIPDYVKRVIDYEKVLLQSSTLPPPSSLAGKILFVTGSEIITNSSDYPQIYTIKDNGTEFTKLTNFPYTGFSDFQPSGFPGQNRIVFVSNKDGNLEIYALNLNNSVVERFTNNGNLISNRDHSPNVSQNGQEIVFISNRSSTVQNKSDEIYLMNADGSNQRKLPNIPPSILQHGSPRWSPDGQKIVFEATETGSAYNLYLVNKDGTGLRKLTNNSYLNVTPSWSYDGIKILFSSTRDGNREIYVMNSDGTNQQRLTSNASNDFAPWFLPDGRIIFISNRDGGYNNLHIMDSNGSNVRKIFTKNYSNDKTPSYFISQ